MSEDRFEPNIVAFCCNWCSYAAADLAGVSRFEMPPNVKILRVMCSGRVRPEYAIKALAEGADGVLVLGCHLGECHYVTGNHRTKKRFEVLVRILDHVGIDPRRVRVDWVSASEAEKFQTVVREFVDELRELGPISSVDRHGTAST